MTIDILINAAPYTLPEPCTLALAIETFGLKGPFAAAVNMEFVPKTRYASTVLQNGDHIELITPITGG
jgi:sulfur carrier protein